MYVVRTGSRDSSVSSRSSAERNVPDDRRNVSDLGNDGSGDDGWCFSDQPSSSASASKVPHLPTYYYERDIVPRRPKPTCRNAGGANGRRTSRGKVVLKPDFSTTVDRRPWEDVHGHHLHKTGDITWCVKCGAYYEHGNPAKYLRSRCNGPITDMLRKQRTLLLTNRHPVTRFPLNLQTERVGRATEGAI